MFISFIPADTGKASAKTNKATVRNGTCKWADPIYETARLLQDSKSKHFEEKLYKLVVAMGTSRSSILGEATINLSDYVDALKPTVAALPLHGSDAGAILNVTVQLLTSKTGFREFEQQREVSDRGLQTNSDHDSGKMSTPGDAAISRIDKVNPRVRFKPESKELPSLEEESEEYSDSAAGFDGSSNTSGSLYAEKQDNSSTREVDSVKSPARGDVGGISLPQSPKTGKGSAEHRFLVQGTHEWVHHLGTEIAVDAEIANVYEENSRLRRSLEAADQSIHELKQEIISLQNHAGDIAVETHKLTEQLTHEIASEQELAKEVSLLKSECLRFKDDLEWLRNLKMNPSVSWRKPTSTNQCKQDLSLTWLKGLSVVEDKVREIQNKVQLGSHGKDSSFLLSDLEALFSVLQDIKQATEHSVYQLDELPGGEANTKISDLGSPKTDHIIGDSGLGAELCHPEGLLLQGLLRHGTGSVDATSAMQGEIFKLLRELDESKTERDNLVRKMDQMECYYEALIQELEENQKQILGELQNLRTEHSSCIYTISSTKAQMEAMHQQMSDELLQLAQERCNLDALNKGLERRAVSSEAALRRARLNYSIAVNQLQKDLETLSLQVLSMYETNANLIQKAFSEASQPLLQGSEEPVPRDLNVEDSDADKLTLSQNLKMGVKGQLQGGDRLLDDLRRSLTLQEGLYQKIQEELSEIHLANVHLDMFSLMLHQAVLATVVDNRLAKEQMHELAKQLQLSSKSNESLKLKLQSVMDDLSALSKEKAISVMRCDDLALLNQRLEVNLNTLSDENRILSEKLRELETESRSYKGKYEDCQTDKAKLATLLEQAAAERENVLNEMSLLQEKLETMKSNITELSSSKESLQKMVDYLRGRVESLLTTGNEQVVSLPSSANTEDKNSEFEVLISMMLRLEELHQCFHHKILLATEEKKQLKNERDIAQLSVASAEAEAETIKQKFQCDIPDMVSKVNVSCTLVEKLQTDLENVGNRLKVSSEAEEKHNQKTHDLLADFAKMEALLNELTSKNEDLAVEIRALGSVSDELEGKKLMIYKMTQANLELEASLQNKTLQSEMLALELNDLRETVGSLQNELSLERHIRNRLEAEVVNLDTQLKEKEQDFLHIDEQEAEVSHLKERLLEIESEKSSICNQLSGLEKHLKKVLAESSNLEIQLEDMHSFLLTADVANTVFVKQYKSHVDELLQKLEYSNQHVEELSKENNDLATRLTSCLASEANYAEENTRLLSTLERLRSDSESCFSLNKVLEHSNSAFASEIEECKRTSDPSGNRFEKAKTDHELEIDELKGLLESRHKEIDDLIFSKEDLEIRSLVLEEKLNEINAQRNLQEEHQGELTMLQRQCSELTRKLAEQTLKTEEFKNLSIHLKELKDNADTEHLQAREKKEAEGSSVAVQESLRIAFIKEQYENKLQEVRRQLSISKKHGEDMLWKLQDAVDELENRKRCEISLLKRNEELLQKIAELEGELQLVLSDNRERFMAYDQLKAELECSTMSLECCNEEKKQLMASLQDCNDEKSRLAGEIELMREQLENLKAFMRNPENREEGSLIVRKNLNELTSSENLLEKPVQCTSCCGREAAGEEFNRLVHTKVKSRNGDADLVYGGEMNQQASQKQDALAGQSIGGTLGLTNGESYFEHNDVEHVALLKDQLKTQTLLSSMDRLQKELEKMRSENARLPTDVDSVGSDCEGLQREQMHLEKVSEELGNMSSLYKDSSRSGNSMERVLALELELAESLQAKAKKKLGIQFQSSFLKLHNDEAAVFQSFRDINELIKDMLEMKGRYRTMEAELKEMHERYSQLSLQLAEVEGERQKLMMTLRNVRSSKRLLNQSPSSSREESSP